MNTETRELETIELEIVAAKRAIVAPADSQLVKYAAETGLEKASTETLVEAFRPIFAKSRAALADARGVAESVKDATCVREIMRSRACRLALRAVRLESDEARKKHKQHALLYGRAVDGFHSILMADLSPVETALKEAEDFAERAEATRLLALKAAREAELVPLLDEPLLGNLADLSEADYMKKFENAQLLRRVKLAEAAKVESDRLAKEAAALAERERLAAENLRLQAEAVAREAAAKAEREAAEKKLVEERAEAKRKHFDEIAAMASKAKAAKEESDRLAEIARKQKVESDAKAVAAEREAAKSRAELAAKLKAEAEAAARVESERRAAEAAAKKAAAAPDKAKLMVFANDISELETPEFTDGQLYDAVKAKVHFLASWCAEQAERL